MPLPTIPVSLYPLVPQAAGVPNLLRSGAAIADTLTLGKLGIGGMLDSLLGASAPKWGIYNSSGKAVIQPDNIISLDVNNSYTISDYPIEKGGFGTYNKVGSPYEVKLTLTKGGSVNDRGDFIDSVVHASNSLALYSVVTPETTYDNVNIIAWGFQRSQSGGAGLAIVDIYCRQVRQIVTAAFTDTKNPASASPMAQGQVQGVTDSKVSAAKVTA